MTADIYRDGFHYHLDFKQGEPAGEMIKEPFKGCRPAASSAGSRTPQVFTDVNVPTEYFTDTMKRQAVVNAGLDLSLWTRPERKSRPSSSATKRALRTT